MQQKSIAELIEALKFSSEFEDSFYLNLTDSLNTCFQNNKNHPSTYKDFAKLPELLLRVGECSKNLDETKLDNFLHQAKYGFKCEFNKLNKSLGQKLKDLYSSCKTLEEKITILLMCHSILENPKAVPSNEKQIPLIKSFFETITNNLLEPFRKYFNDKGYRNFSQHELNKMFYKECINNASKLEPNLPFIQFLILNGADVNITNNRGKTVLHRLDPQGELDKPLIDLLLLHGANPYARNKEMKLPEGVKAPELPEANKNVFKILKINNKNTSASIQLYETGLSQLINKEGFDVNARNKDGRTSLHLAVYHGHLNIVNALLAKGADIYARDNNGNTPITAAFTNTATSEQLSCARAIINSAQFDLTKAIATGHYTEDEVSYGMNSLEFHLSENAPRYNVSYDDGEQVKSSAQSSSRNLKLFKLLISKYTPENINSHNNFGETILMTLLRYNHTDPKLWKLITNIRGFNLYATDTNGNDIFDLLKISIDQNNPDHCTTNISRENATKKRQGLYDVSRLLLSIKYTKFVNIPNNAGYYPLTQAIMSNNLELAQKLATSPEIDLSKRDSNGDSYIIQAIKEERYAIAKYLISISPPDILNLKDKDGATALHWLSWKEQHKTIPLAIQRGADTQIKEDDGKTFYAGKSKYDKICLLSRLLVSPSIIFTIPIAMGGATLATFNMNIINDYLSPLIKCAIPTPSFKVALCTAAGLSFAATCIIENRKAIKAYFNPTKAAEVNQSPAEGNSKGV